METCICRPVTMHGDSICIRNSCSVPGDLPCLQPCRFVSRRYRPTDRSIRQLACITCVPNARCSAQVGFGVLLVAFGAWRKACSELANLSPVGCGVRVRRFVHAIASLGRRATADPAIRGSAGEWRCATIALRTAVDSVVPVRPVHARPGTPKKTPTHSTPRLLLIPRARRQASCRGIGVKGALHSSDPVRYVKAARATGEGTGTVSSCCCCCRWLLCVCDHSSILVLFFNLNKEIVPCIKSFL